MSLIYGFIFFFKMKKRITIFWWAGSSGVFLSFFFFLSGVVKRAGGSEPAVTDEEVDFSPRIVVCHVSQCRVGAHADRDPMPPSLLDSPHHLFEDHGRVCSDDIAGPRDRLVELQERQAYQYCRNKCRGAAQ